MAHPHAHEVTACPSCGAKLAGPFCHQCGEARPDPHDFSWKHAFHDAVHEFIHLDGKILQTLWLLIRRPGMLTAEYWDGRRRLHIRPLRLYILLAAVHLVAMSHSYYRMESFLKLQNSGPLYNTVTKVAARRHITREAAQEAINEKLAKAYSVTQYLAVLGFALAPWALYRKRRPHYLQHLIFAIHVYGFWFLVISLASLILPAEVWQRSPLPLVTAAYLFFAIRRLYGEGTWTAVWKAIVLRIGLFAAEFLAIGVAFAAAFGMLLGGQPH